MLTSAGLEVAEGCGEGFTLGLIVAVESTNTAGVGVDETTAPTLSD